MTMNFSRCFRFILISLAALSLPISAQTLEPLNKVIAIVNNTVITQNELDERIELARKQKIQITSEQAAEELVMEQLQLQRATQMGASINDSSMDKMLEHIAKQNNLTLNELLNAVKSEGIKLDEYKKGLKNQQLISFARQKEVMDTITVTDQEVEQFLSSANSVVHSQNAQKTEYRIAHHLIALSSNPNPTELKNAQKQAQEIIEKLKNNQPTPLQDLGWRKTVELPTLFVNIVPSMKKNEAIGPIQSESGLHIIQLLDKHAPKNALSSDPATQKQQAQQMIKNRKANEKLAIWLQKLRSDAYVQVYLEDK